MENSHKDARMQASQASKQCQARTSSHHIYWALPKTKTDEERRKTREKERTHRTIVNRTCVHVIRLQHTNACDLIDSTLTHTFSMFPIIDDRISLQSEIKKKHNKMLKSNQRDTRFQTETASQYWNLLHPWIWMSLCVWVELLNWVEDGYFYKPPNKHAS